MELLEFHELQHRGGIKTDSKRSDLLLGGEINFCTTSVHELVPICLFGKSAAYSRYGKDIATFWHIFAATIAVTTFATLTSASVSRIPKYQDVETAIESTKCAVRETIVDIREVYPTLPPEVKLMPSCVLLQRCSGCCSNDIHKCMPTEIYKTQIEISRQMLNSAPEYFSLNFTHHAQCACQSPINPTCIPTICSEQEKWNSDQCRCEPRCEPDACGPGQEWNSAKCRCQCRRCHPEHRIHLRFSQDSDSCICACRYEKRNRIACKRRRTGFDASTCSCSRRQSQRYHRRQHR